MAVKFLSGDVGRAEKEQFVKEASRLARLHHPHIVAQLASCFNVQPNFIVMELMTGGDLKAYLVECRPVSWTSKEAFTDGVEPEASINKLPLAKKIKIGQQIASALEYLASIKFDFSVAAELQLDAV